MVENAGVRLSVAVGAADGANATDAAGGGAWYGGGADLGYPSASVVKVSVLAALLRRGGELDARRRAWARAMIVRSDNDAATALWRELGGPGALDEAYAEWGLTGTYADPAWGLTRTTARDQLTLLRTVFRERPYAYLRELMGRVVPDQAWGVSAAAGGPAGADGWALKNGWMPMRATGLWVVHSVGRVGGRAGGRLVVVLSDGHPSKEAGIARVEEAARRAAGEGGWYGAGHAG
ncbi:serine hydrolase [Streptomyces sp. NPDC058953]|uniref:serine hydrolase n=1 Tax=unclassified Streptomyces TaxID=2593676 RepID=UPI0036AF1289